MGGALQWERGERQRRGELAWAKKGGPHTHTEQKEGEGEREREGRRGSETERVKKGEGII